MQQSEIKPFDLDAKVHPDLKGFLNAMSKEGFFAPFTKEEVPEKRKQFEKMLSRIPPKTFDDVTTTTRSIPGPKDAPEVTVRIHEPKNRDGRLPAFLWIVGGGFFCGKIEAADNFAGQAVREVGCVFIAVQHRFAPENPFPAGLEDCYAALTWIRDSAEELGVDVNRIGVGGMSSGGGLCAAVALLARDRGGPKICFQMPLYGMLDDRNDTVSSHQMLDPRILSRSANILSWQLYLGEDKDKEVSQYAAVARATDLSGLPPAYIWVSELDVVRDENIEFVKRLSAAGVPVEFHLHPGCFHGFEGLSAAAGGEVSKRAAEDRLKALKRYLYS